MLTLCSTDSEDVDSAVLARDEDRSRKTLGKKGMTFVCPRCTRPMRKDGFTPGGKQRWGCYPGGAFCYTTTAPDLAAERSQSGVVKRKGKTPIFKRTLGGKSTFIITAAQNATPVHQGFLKACEALCNERNGEILAIPLRYKNPTSRWTASQANEEVWADALAPHMCNQRKRLNANLIVLGDIKTQPTAVNPLTGYEALTHGESGILGHTKLALKTIATPQSKFPKIMTTTGAMTIPNYTDSRAGKIGEFHHTLGAALVEISGKKFHLRQLSADKEGTFTDLDQTYSEFGRTKAEKPLALVMGDTHVDFIDPAVERSTFGKGGLVDTLQPAHLVWHDLLDGYAINPHHNGNPFAAIAKVQNNRNDAKEELMRALEFIHKRTPDGVTSVVVPSNHEDFLSRWIINQDWRNNPANAEFYLETALAMVRGTQFGGAGTTYPSPFIYWGRKELAYSSVLFLERDESFAVAGVELGMHGDQGPNGARGSIKNLRRIGIRSIIGHSHSPGIDEGCYQTGTSTRLKLEYNGGPSGWLNTHCILYANGKRTLVNIIDGEYRL